MSINDARKPCTECRRFTFNKDQLCDKCRIALRDWFAGQALAGRRNSGRDSREMAAWSYEIADAMLKERSK
jgi:hypothetical protein